MKFAKMKHDFCFLRGWSVYCVEIVEKTGFLFSFWVGCPFLCCDAMDSKYWRNSEGVPWKTKIQSSSPADSEMHAIFES